MDVELNEMSLGYSENVNVWEYRPLTGGYSLPMVSRCTVQHDRANILRTNPRSVTVQYINDGVVLAVGKLALS